MVISWVLDVVYGSQHSASGPERRVHMESLKQYCGKPLRSWSVSEDCHRVAIKADVTAVFSSHEDVPFSEKGEVSGFTWCQCRSTATTFQPWQGAFTMENA